MMSLKNYPLLIFLVFLFFSCKDDDAVPSSGTANFRAYLAVGNSLTAGYSDGGLYRAAQLSSYPAILSRQLSQSSGMQFTQPLMPEGPGSGYIELLAYPVNGFPLIDYVDEDPRAFDKVSGPFHNLGIPGIRVKDIEMKDYGIKSNNEYFYRILPAGAEDNTSYLDLLADSNHSFFTCWMGNNDVLGFATEGGVHGEAESGEYGRSGLTNVDEFETKYNLMVQVLTANEAKGVVMTIPDILYLPYFNFVTNENFPSLSASQIEQLNAQYAEHNQLIQEYNSEIESDESLTEEQKQALYRETIHFKNSDNSFVIEDKSLPDAGKTDNEGNPVPKIRHLREDDKITIPGILEIIQFGGVNRPLGDRYVLTDSEITLLSQYRNGYNEIIKNVAANADIALLDVDEVLEEFKNGKTVDGVHLSTEIIEGGLFSLDGIHLTQRGYALVANKIIETINSDFNAEIPKVNISQYPGVDMP